VIEDDLTILVTKRTCAAELGVVEHVASVDVEGVGTEDGS
jgi:hypothetical protein